MGQCEERLPQGEGERGSYFQHGPVVFDERLQVRQRLVVRRVRFEHQVRPIVQHSTKGTSLRPVVIDHPQVIKLDARLNDETDHPAPGVLDPVRVEGRLMSSERGPR